MAIYLGENKVNVQLKANLGDQIEWSDVLNKPDSYVPQTHYHSQYQLSGNYLSSSTFIPTKTSELENDVPFISSHQSLSGYYTKAESDQKFQLSGEYVTSSYLTSNYYDKLCVDSKISAIDVTPQLSSKVIIRNWIG